MDPHCVVPGMAAANLAARLADGEAQPMDVEDMRSTYEHLERSDPAEDICVIELDGAIAGYAGSTGTTWSAAPATTGP